MARFEYNFPSIRGVQAGRDYYVSMCPLKLIPKVFLFDEEELSPELRAQRSLNRNRVPEIANYITSNQNDYVFSALTASIDGEVKFNPIGGDDEYERLGVLQVDMQSRFIINDGQHRRAAIEQAIRENSDVGEETIAVVFFIDRGLARSQQMFADLNRYAVRTSKSLGLLYDHRNDSAKIARLVAFKCDSFKGLVELDKTALSDRSRKLFTLSSLNVATNELLSGRKFTTSEIAAEAAIRFWSELAKHIPEWGLVRESKMTSGEIRRDFVHSHGVMLQAFGRVGAELARLKANDYKKLGKLNKINWQRANTKDWEGRVLIGGRISKSSNSIALASAFIKEKLGLPVTPDEAQAVTTFSKFRR